MRLLMTPAMVTVSPEGSLVAVGWAPPGPRRAREADPAAAAPPDGRPAPRPHAVRPRRVLEVIDRWRYDGRWWDGQEVHRDYFFVELEGGVRVELFNEAGDWWVARVSD